VISKYYFNKESKEHYPKLNTTTSVSIIMLEKFITKLLNKYLGQYIELLDKDQLDITLRSGKIELENVKLKSTIFEGLPVPFTLAYG
jgi:hypothetical protein